MRLGIDPGHGGLNHGTRAGGVIEEDVTLRIAQDLEFILPRPVEVTLLRQGDETVSHAARGLRAVNMDWALPIHVNAHVQSRLHGAECYIRPGHRQAEREVAEAILAAMPVELRTRRIIVADPRKGKWLENPLVVLKHLTCPAVLLEVCYASNPGDLRVLLSDWGRLTILAAIQAGVARMMEIHSAAC